MSEATNGFRWRSQSAFVVVAAGATLSLNDFLTFPAMAGQNGGGAFLILYLLFLFLLGLPLMMSELLLGRISRTDPTHCFESLARLYNASVYWKAVGFTSVIAAVLIVATFSVIAGWSLAYSFKSAIGVYHQITLEDAAAVFDALLMDSERMALWHTLFVILLVSIVSQPVKLGIQKLSMLLVPGMIVLLIISLVLAIYSSAFGRSVEYMLYVDFSAFDSDTPLLALQRAFYTLTLGIGLMMAFGRYLPTDISLGYSAGLVITVDLLLTVFVGLVINSLIFSSGMEVGADNQFAFRLLPAVFGQFEFGQIFGAMFFLLLVVAALTTSVALMESPVGYLQRQFNYTRLKSTIIIVLLVWLFGIGTVFSYSVWHDDGFTIALFFGDEAVRLVNNAGFHDVLVFLSSYLIQPVVALLLCLFVAWIIPREVSFKELALPGRHWFELWNYLVRYITPVLLLVIFLKSIGVF
ncbi:MAG: sodium-dependent transporter [Gammaproteobacteria bacterium]|nr:sodium-dependent transporter [Gammaproteobacteria bacterium]